MRYLSCMRFVKLPGQRGDLKARGYTLTPAFGCKARALKKRFPSGFLKPDRPSMSTRTLPPVRRRQQGGDLPAARLHGTRRWKDDFALGGPNKPQPPEQGVGLPSTQATRSLPGGGGGIESSGGKLGGVLRPPASDAQRGSAVPRIR